jgi:amidohydrolase
MFEQEILEISKRIQPRLVEIRRDIHAHPELGLSETRTAELIAHILSELDIEVTENVGITGVVGLLKGAKPGNTILLRADMDCLEINELNDVSYKSQTEGLMHACGHDSHTTWLLGTAMILSELRDHIKGNVKFVFQPAEESEGGADRMIKAGVLENPKVDFALGAHVWPILESGKIGLKRGSMMAAPDRFSLKILGKGGHGAEPHNTIDPIAIACQVYMSLQTIVSRKINPIDPAVISVTVFNAGTAHNIIPDRVEMMGTVRSLTPEIRAYVPGAMEKLIKGIVESNGAQYEFDYDPYYPPLINHDAGIDLVAEASANIIGAENTVMLPNPTMGGEDFSYFLEKVPGAFFVVGTKNEDKGIIYPLHNPRFNIDEDILHQAAAVMAESALIYLNK